MSLSTTASITFILLVIITRGLSQSVGLTQLTPCICLGSEATYECYVTGDTATIWQGTALEECQNGNIILRHSQFTSENIFVKNKTCGATGLVVGRSNLPLIESYYASQLTIQNVSQQLIGTSVECASESEHVASDSRQISLPAPSEPPTNIRLSRIDQQQLTISWNPSYKCPAVFYEVSSTNCGDCPNTTKSNSITCNITSLALPQLCLFSLQTVVCNDVYGSFSEQNSVILQVPNSPKKKVIPEYSGETSNLKKIIVKINHTAGTDVLDAMDTTYTINYVDTSSSLICGSHTIVTSSGRGIYDDTFIISSSYCPSLSDIAVTAFAANSLGNGPNSDTILIRAINQYIEIDLDFVVTRSIKCTFREKNSSPLKYCRVDYEPSTLSQCTGVSFSSFSEGIATTSDTVLIQLDPSNKQHFVYCYRVTASDGVNMITIAGKSCACNPDQLSNSQIIPDSGFGGNSYSVLGIENGIVCFNGITLGSTALYLCRDCGYDTILKSTESLVRTCEQNGQWNGTIPRCDCRTGFGNGLLFGVVGGSVALITTVIITIFAVIIIALLRAKAKLTAKLEGNKDSESKIYEEVDQVSQQSSMNTADNVAYVSCHNFGRRASCSFEDVH